MDANVTFNTSLDQLHDILIPPAVSNWPLAPGWYALGLLVLAYGFHVASKYWTWYQKNLYRREALQELTQITSEEKSLFQMKALLTLMKRVGLHHFGRREVAALCHDQWWDFMQRHSKAKISTKLRKLSQKILYTPHAQASIQDLKEMSSVAEKWIKTHQGKEDA